MHHLALPGNVILLWPLNLCLMEDSSNLLHLSSETKPEYIRYEYKLRDWFTICNRKYFIIFRRTTFSIKLFLAQVSDFIYFLYLHWSYSGFFYYILIYTDQTFFAVPHCWRFQYACKCTKNDAINILKYRNGSLPPDVSLKMYAVLKKLPNIRINETNI